VTPDGPAAESGIEAGDVLTGINGASLLEPGAPPGFGGRGMGPVLQPLPADAVGGAAQVIQMATPVQFERARSDRATTPH